MQPCAPPTPTNSAAFRSSQQQQQHRLTFLLLVEGVHAGEIDGQRFERGRQAHLALGAMDAHPGSCGGGVVPLPAHGDRRAVLVNALIFSDSVCKKK